MNIVYHLYVLSEGIDPVCRSVLWLSEPEWDVKINAQVDLIARIISKCLIL